MATAATNLHRVAAEIHDVPRAGLIAVARAGKKIAAEEGARAGGPLVGKKRRGLKLRAVDTIKPTATGAICRIQGVSPAAWVWVTTGTDPHRIRRRKRGPMRTMTVPHPGTSGSGAWRRVVAHIEADLPRIMRAEVARRLH